MVIDFSKIREVAKGWVDTHLDHKMLLNRSDPLVKTLQEHGEPVFLMDGNPTAENIAKLIFGELQRQGLRISRVNLWETPTGCAVYSEDRS
jgi:6-pyruvoyltetrahydropterin/6-carboxytetrahydropterin synthase